MLSSIYLVYAAIVLLALVGCLIALVATTRDTVGGYGTKGDAALMTVVFAFAAITIVTSVV